MTHLKFYMISYFYSSKNNQGYGRTSCFLDKNKIKFSNARYIGEIEKKICKFYNYDNVIINNII
jgi:hypothetical protein